MNRKLLLLATGMLWAQTAHAVIYPKVQTLQPPVDLEIGEVALNTLLNKAFAKSYDLGSGATAVRIRVNRVACDIEADRLTVALNARVDYDLLGTPKTYTLNFSQTVPVASITFTYSGVRKRVTMALSGVAATLDAALPDYVKTALTSEFGQFALYPNELMQDLGGPIENGTTLLQKSFSIVFRDDYKVTFALQKDLIKLTVAPKWEIEDFDFGLWAMGGGEWGFVGQFVFESNVPLQITQPWIGDVAGNYQQFDDVIPLEPATPQNGFPRYFVHKFYQSATKVGNKESGIIFRANENNQLTHFHTTVKYNGMDDFYSKWQLDMGNLGIK